MPISDYLRGLRAKVGQALVLMPAVTIICRDDQGRVLLARHRDYDQWALPGGSIDPGETPANAAVREMWEETGLLVEPVHILGVYGGPTFTWTYPNGDQVAYVDTVFVCRIVGGTPAADQEEISELRYFTQAEMAQLVLPPWMTVVLADLFNGTVQTCFQPALWMPPADGLRKGGISDYVRQLRQHIGHDLLLMPAVGAVVFDEQGQILLQQRADNGRWSAPVGGMDPYEVPGAAALREVWEETGILAEPVRVLGVYGGPQMHNTHPNGDQTASVLIIFECRALAGTPSADAYESIDAKFFPVDEAMMLLAQRWRERMGTVLEIHAHAHFEPATWRPT